MSKKFLTGIDVDNQRIINVADPTSATDAVNRQYLESLIQGLRWKQPVRAASTANVTTSSPGTTLDGVTLTAGDRILLKNQTTGSQNGIYTWSASASALVRATDADTAAEVHGAAVMVQEGTVNANKLFTQTADSVTLNTTTLTFVEFSGGGSTYTAGNGLGLSGGAFSVTAGAGIVVDGSGVSIDTAVVARKYAIAVPSGSTTATITHNLGTKDVVVAVYVVSSNELVECDVAMATTNTVTLTFATAPTSNQYRCVVIG